MLAEWQIQDLLQLMRRRYRGWEDFDEPAFVADEIAYKRATAAKFAELFSQAECDRLIGAGEYEPFLERLEKLCLDNNLLWRRVPSVGETAVFHHPALDKPTFCTQVRNLLYADRPSPARLQSFSDYLTAHHLPNKWPLPTYLLFMCQPNSEFLVRSAPIEWFLKFMGAPQKVRGVPDSAVYAIVLDKARALLRELRLYGARDMVDVQSFVWVCAKEAGRGIEGLSPKAQIELDVPQILPNQPTTYQISNQVTPFREAPELYMSESDIPSVDVFIDVFLKTLKTLGGKANNQEISDRVVQMMGLSEAQQRKRLLSGSTAVNNKIAWAKIYLKRYGAVENPHPKEWALTSLGWQIEKITRSEIERAIKQRGQEIENEVEIADEDVVEETRNNSLFNSIVNNPEYSLDQCAKETGFDKNELSRWLQALERKKQAVFYGPPGTGKTFVTQKIAQHLVSESDGLVELVQFHPAYAYEDFIQGIRPFTINGILEYQLTPGRFLQFCAKAQARTGPCILIIDEINRANLASVFGELMYLLEYRQQEIPLAGGGRFSIPANVRIIGTMNTADRSIALVDHALRRRFAFIHLPPNYDLLRRYHAETSFPANGLIALLKDLNNAIDDPHYHVGHSFFLRPNLAQDLEDIWCMEIEPYLEEYFFNQTDQLKNFRWAQIAKRILT